MLIPLAILPNTLAIPIWLTVVAGSTLLLIALLRRMHGLGLAAVAVLAFAPTTVSLYAGNVSAIIAVLYALALRDAEEAKDTRAAGWLFFGALLKLTPAVGIATLFARGRWRACLLPGIAAAAMVLFLLPWAGLSTWWTGALRATTIPGNEFASWASDSWTAILEFRTPFGVAVLPLTVLLKAVTLWRGRSLPLVWALAAASLLPLLIARITWTNHAVMALPALALLWRSSPSGKLLAAGTWLGIALLGGIAFAMPLLLTLCWGACCWPRLLETSVERQEVGGGAQATQEWWLSGGWMRRQGGEQDYECE